MIHRLSVIPGTHFSTGVAAHLISRSVRSKEVRIRGGSALVVVENGRGAQLLAGVNPGEFVLDHPGEAALISVYVAD